MSDPTQPRSKIFDLDPPLQHEDCYIHEKVVIIYQYDHSRVILMISSVGFKILLLNMKKLGLKFSDIKMIKGNNINFIPDRTLI